MDPDKRSVYSCEERLAQAVAVGTVSAFGVRWQLEPDRRYATLASAGLDAAVTCMELGLPPVTVRHRAGHRSSHYEPANATIALASWGGSAATLAHELAHHQAWVTHRHLAHGVEFRTALVELLDHLGAPQQAGFLRAAFAEAGLLTLRPA